MRPGGRARHDPYPSTIKMGLGQRYGDFIVNYALGHGTIFGRDFFERRGTEELFLI